MRLIIFFITTVVALQVNAQPLKSKELQSLSKEELAEILNKVNENYKKLNYSFDLTYSLYKDHMKANLLEKSIGYSKRYLQNFEGYQNNVYTIQNSQYKVIVDSTEQVVLVSNKDTSYFRIFDQQVTDFITMVSEAKKVIRNKETQLILELNPEHRKVTYHININEINMVTWMEVWYHYNPFIDPLFPDKSIENDKYLLRLDFFNINLRYKPVTNGFNIERIIQKKGDEIHLVNVYKNYELVDLRLK